MPLLFEQDFKVQHSECDPWDRMSPGALLRRVQEISTVQCDELGLDESIYVKTGTLFMLSRLSLEIKKPAVLGQHVIVKTVPYGVKRAVFHRVTTMYSDEGEVLCETDARWVLTDVNSRKILRKYPQELEMFSMDLPEDAPQHDMKLPKAEGAKTVSEYKAVYSLCDRNMHMNNTRYADIVCDNLPVKQLSKQLPAKMLLFFREEIPMGQGFTLKLKEEKGGWLFAAEAEESRKFDCFVTF